MKTGEAKRARKVSKSMRIAGAGNVINTLATMDTKDRGVYAPYRQSKLTRTFLQERSWWEQSDLVLACVSVDTNTGFIDAALRQSSHNIQNAPTKKCKVLGCSACTWTRVESELIKKNVQQQQ
jgi:hypothetical protein